ncbi:MAG: HlyD family efflux transporter periplasmic adaptor subunit [bacterium]
MSAYYRLRDDLVCSKGVVDGNTVYNIKDPRTGRYFRLREPEYWLVRQLDGHTSSKIIADRFRRKFNARLTATDVDQFVAQLSELRFLDDGRAEQELSRKSYLAGRGESLFARLLFVKIRGFNPQLLLDRLVKVYRPFHHWFWWVVQLLIVIVALVLLAANFRYFNVDLSTLLQPGSLVAAILAVFVVVALHEFAHAIVCRHYGGEVREMGFLLLYFQPCFYTDLSDAWLFEKKAQRLVVTAAGPLFQLVLMALAVLIWRVTVIGTFINELALIITLVCLLTALFNFNPLIKLDGYYLLSDWVEIPNLRRRAFDYLSNMIKRRLLGWPIEPLSATIKEKRTYLLYATLALFYSVGLIGYVLVVAARFLVAHLGAAGLMLLLAVLLFTLRTVLVGFGRGLVKHLSYMKSLWKKPLRLTIHIVIAVAVVVVVFALPVPHRVSGEVTVRPVEEFTLLLNEYGLLEHNYRRGGADPESQSGYLQVTTTEMAALDLVPLVRDGQQVRLGDTLAIMVSNQVIQEIAANQALLEKYKGQLALLKAPPKKEAIAEAESQVAAARAGYDQFQREMDRIAELAEKNLSSREELESARSAVQIASAELSNKESRLQLLLAPPRPEEIVVLQAEIERQKARLDFLKAQQEAQSIITPIEGTITTHHTGDAVLTVINNRVIELLTPVSDFDIGLVAKGQTVRCKLRSFPERTFTGRVVHIPGSAHTVDGSARFIVSIVVDNTDGLLCNGMSGYAKIEVGKSSMAGLIVRKLASVVRVEFWSWW